MKEPHVDRLGANLTAKEFIRWEQYEQLEPFGEAREDFRVAYLVTFLANLWGRKRDKKGNVVGEPYKVEQFLKDFREPEPRRRQSAQEQFNILKVMTEVHNYQIEQASRKEQVAMAAARKAMS